MEKKKSFVMYTENEKYLKKLNNEQQGQLIMAVLAYVDRDELPEFDGALAMAFTVIQNRIDEDYIL